MFSPEQSSLFHFWRDPISGVQSMLLKGSVVAPLQQSFYFTNPGMTPDGRFLWFYCAFPPAGDANYGRCLGVVDFGDDTIRYFPETQFLDASPCVDPLLGDVYWVTGLEIWRRGPKEADRAVLINQFSTELAKDRRPHRIATHLTFSADRTALNVDIQIGNKWYVGDAPLNGSPMRIWQCFDRCYNHGQFSPTDPDLQLIAQDWWIDPATGHHGTIENRLWLIRRGESAKPIFTPGSPQHAHEWWDSNGRQVWYVDYESGTWRVDIATHQPILIWPNGTCHSHANTDGTLLVGDIGTYSWEHGCRVAAFNPQNGREVNIVSNMPLPQLCRGKYHIDPHPQFCCNDSYVCYTTTVGGCVTVAMVRVDHLQEMTQ
jgi:hypothetical protein